MRRGIGQAAHDDPGDVLVGRRRVQALAQRQRHPAELGRRTQHREVVVGEPAGPHRDHVEARGPNELLVAQPLLASVDGRVDGVGDPLRQLHHHFQSGGLRRGGEQARAAQGSRLERRAEVGAVGAVHRGRERVVVLERADDHVCARGPQARRPLVRSPCEGANRIILAEQLAHDRPAGLAGRAGDENGRL